jgi:hypothetical protein
VASTVRGAALAGAVVMLVGCSDVDVVTNAYATLDEARRAGAVQRGWVPDGLPPGTRELREAHNLDTNRRWGLFNFPPAEGDALKALLEPAELPLQGYQIEPPRRIEWWPLLLRGAIDGERLRSTGVRVYRARTGDMVFAVNWPQGRAYYWSHAH